MDRNPSGVDSPIRGRYLRSFRIAAILAILLYPFLYSGIFLGDAQIHLVYGSNAAEGRYFEFNPGEKSAGVTSPAYMILLALPFKALPNASLVPMVVKGMSILSWYILALLVYHVAKALLQDPAWTWLVTLTAGLLPGSAYNATTGMENGLFGVLVLLCTHLLIRWQCLANVPLWTLPREITLGMLLGMACWIRPEGLIVSAIVVLYRAFLFRRSFADLGDAMRRSAPLVIVLMLFVASLAMFHFSQTGKWLPDSGVARMVASWSRSFYLGPIMITPKVAIRFVYYFPLTALWLVGNWLILGRRVSASSSSMLTLMLVITWTFFALYSSILGATHLARYMIFVMPFVVVVTGLGGMWLWRKWTVILPTRLRSVTFISIAIILAGVFVYESALRRKMGQHTELAELMRAVDSRKQHSDDLYRQMGEPSALPISILCQEVQIRLWLDERFVVRSTDGRVDAVLLRYYHDGNYDHIGYIKERGITFVTEMPNYNRDGSLWSLAKLKHLKPGEQVCRENLVFTRMTQEDLVRVDHVKHGSSGQITWDRPSSHASTPQGRATPSIRGTP